jgi:hypothetical protein
MKTLLHAAALLAGAPALALLSGSAAAQLSVDHQVGIPGFSPAAYRGADGFGGGAMGGAKLWRASQSPGGEAALYEKRQEASVTSNVNKELDRSVVLLRDFNRDADELIGKRVQMAALGGGGAVPGAPGTTGGGGAGAGGGVAPRTGAGPGTTTAPPAPSAATPTPEIPATIPGGTPLGPAPAEGGGFTPYAPGAAPVETGPLQPPQNHNDLKRAQYDAMFKGTPIEGLYDQVVEAAGRHNVPPSLVAAVFAHESAKCTSDAMVEGNNPGGYSPGGGGPKYFKTLYIYIYINQRLLFAPQRFPPRKHLRDM